MKGGPGKNKYGDPKHGVQDVQHLGGGGVVKKRKGYKHGGTVLAGNMSSPKVNVMTNKPVEVAHTTAESLKRAGIK